MLPCPLGNGCKSGPQEATWTTVDVAMEVAERLLTEHVKVAHPIKEEAAGGEAPATLKAEKLVRPNVKIRDGVIEDEAWEYFIHKWNTYKAQANLTVATKSHLESCLGDDVTAILFGRLGADGWDQLTEETLLDEVKNVFVKKRNRMVNRLKLHHLLQGDLPVQQYVSMLKSIARTCKYSVTCSTAACNTKVDYSHEMVLDQLVRGLNDTEIQRKVLACKEEDFNLDSVEKVIIAEESSKASQLESKASTQETGYVAPLTTYQRNKKMQYKNAEKSNKSCKNCGSTTHQSYWELPDEKKRECKAHKKFCSNCGKPNHIDVVCKEPEGSDDEDKEAIAEANSLMAFEALDDEGTMKQLSVISSKHQIKPRLEKSTRPILQHAEHDKTQQNCSLIVDIIVNEDEYKAHGGKKSFDKVKPKIDHEVIADTGADVCCSSPEEAKLMGFKLSETFQSSLQLFAADGHRLKVHGCLPVVIFAGTYDKPRQVHENLYFVDGFKNTVLSRKALKELGSVSPNFPEIASVSIITSKKAVAIPVKP